MQKFGRGQGTALQLFLAFSAALVVHAHGRVQFFLAFLFAPQVDQCLSAKIMNIRACRIELECLIGLAQSLRLFLFPQLNLRQAGSRICQPGIAAQRFAVTLLRIGVLLHQGVDVAEFVVVQRKVGLDRSIFQKLVPRVLVILFFQIREPEVEVHEGKLGIGIGGGFKFRQCLIVLLEIQMILADKQPVFRRTVADLDQLPGSTVIEAPYDARGEPSVRLSTYK